jgi:hypothetical protein
VEEFQWNWAHCKFSEIVFIIQQLEWKNSSGIGLATELIGPVYIIQQLEWKDSRNSRELQSNDIFDDVRQQT